MGFREEYSKFNQPSSAREEFVHKAITKIPKENIVNNMKPVTVSRPDGTKITYKVMPDYLMVDGMRVPMSGNTAQKVADYFGLKLPTAEIAQEIYQNADVKVTAKPLSGSGVSIDGRQYSGNEVVNTGVGYAPFAVHYNYKIDKQLSDQGVQAGDNKIVSGFAKDIISPSMPGRLGLYGLYDAHGKPIQGGTGITPHDTSTHTEYGSFVRLISPTVTITHPDGNKEIKPISSVYQYGKYTPKKEDSEKPKSGRLSLLQRIDKFLDKI